MKRLTLSLLLGASALLAACVDTTGIKPDSSKSFNPATNGNAAVVLTEYGDLQCPACKAAHDALVVPLVQKYAQQIRFEWRHFPLRSIHRFALDAAEASECAADQGKFWEYVDLDYLKQKDLNDQALKDWAAELKLDTDLFGRCFDSGIKKAAVVKDYEEGVKAGVPGATPTFFVNGKIVATEDLEKAIQEALQTMGKNL